MKIAVVAIVCLAAASQLVVSARRHSSLAQWERYKRQFAKVYDRPEEDARRFALFLKACEDIEQHNVHNESYKKGLTHLSDWTEEEFNGLNGLRVDVDVESLAGDAPNSPQAEAFLQRILDDPAPVAKEFDWRDVPNRVGPVKDQQRCGSCWAFATTGLLEGQQVVQNFTRRLVPLSEQELVDCSQLNNACAGGLMTLALKDIAGLGGIEGQKDYSYVARDEECRYDQFEVVMTVLDDVVLPHGNEEALKKVVARYGPVSTGVQATDNWMHYKSGLINDKTCREGRMNHGVLIVGYGTDPKEGDYWLVKNSWGSRWGEDGYFKIKRGNLSCSIGTASVIAMF